jgi:hypothetical protein
MLKLIKIKQKYQDAKFNGLTLDKIYHNFITTQIHNLHGRDVVDIQRQFLDKSTKSCQISLFLYYSSLNTKHSNTTNYTFEQLAYMFNCSYPLIEKVVKKLKKHKIIKHEINSQCKHLTKKFRNSVKCNPFKFIFIILKAINRQVLKTSGFRTNFVAPAKPVEFREIR